jgi:hypothetical protein
MKRALKGNNFFANCRFSHTADDDPSTPASR